jgi:crossover junction endodeoxyribonuclease RuvC
MKEAKRLVVGIDPSLCGTALCLIDEDMAVQMMRFPSDSAGMEVKARFGRYRLLVHSVVSHIPWDGAEIERVLIESYSFGSKGNAVLNIAEYGGMLRDRLITETDLLDFPSPIEVSPTVVKKFATGKGNGDKMAVAVALSRRYDVQYGTSDEYDAYAIARIGACLMGWCEAETDFQREAIDAVLHGSKSKAKKKKSA